MCGSRHPACRLGRGSGFGWGMQSPGRDWGSRGGVDREASGAGGCGPAGVLPHQSSPAPSHKDELQEEKCLIGVEGGRRADRSVSFRVQCLGMRLVPGPPWPRRTLKDHPNTRKWGSQGQDLCFTSSHGPKGPWGPRGSWGDKEKEFKEETERKERCCRLQLSGPATVSFGEGISLEASFKTPEGGTQKHGRGQSLPHLPSQRLCLAFKKLLFLSKGPPPPLSPSESIPTSLDEPDACLSLPSCPLAPTCIPHHIFPRTALTTSWPCHPADPEVPLIPSTNH